MKLVICFTLACACGTSPARTGADGDAGPSFGLLDGSTGQCEVHCSADLHQVIDCNGIVTKTCEGDQGCGLHGTCVPACESAKENQSTLGCEYYSFAPPIDPIQTCYAVFITNTWDAPVDITVDGDATYDIAQFARLPSGSGKSLSYAPLPSGKLPPGQVAILFLNQYRTVENSSGGPMPDQATCPQGVTTATFRAPLSRTGVGHTYHISTSAPVVAYDMVPYGGGKSAVTSASLLLPTSAWGKNYVAIDGYHLGDDGEPVSPWSPWIGVVASDDDTIVTIRPRVDLQAGEGVEGAPKGVPHSYRLGRGQLLFFEQFEELAGSPIESSKPIGVWGGNGYVEVPFGSDFGDSMHQQISPISALGSSYAAVRYRNRFDDREETPPWRIIGAVSGTQLTYSPSRPANAPESLSEGQVAEFESGQPFLVSSQDSDHPFYVGAYMDSCSRHIPGYDPLAIDTSAFDCRGDPEWINVVPTEQFLSSYVFFTDPTYSETNLVVVRKKAPAGPTYDVVLDCAGTLDGWQPLDPSFEYVRIDLVRGNFEGQHGCDNGRHEIRSDAPFGLTIWGWGTKQTGVEGVSYAYPAGQGVRPINSTLVPAVPR